MVDLRRAAAIVGVHEHITRYAPDKSEAQIQGESIIEALKDAGPVDTYHHSLLVGVDLCQNQADRLLVKDDEPGEVTVEDHRRALRASEPPTPSSTVIPTSTHRYYPPVLVQLRATPDAVGTCPTRG